MNEPEHKAVPLNVNMAQLTQQEAALKRAIVATQDTNDKRLLIEVLGMLDIFHSLMTPPKIQ